VITVSEDPSIAPGGAVRLERYAVGVHQLNNGVLERIPAVTGGSGGPAIIETPAPLPDIARETARPARPGVSAIPQPAIGQDITFIFANAATADRALAALGLPAQGRATVSIDDPAALRRIISSMQAVPGGTQIRFQAGGQSFQASVASGPGGNFLSNEVSFRVLRQLGAGAGTTGPTSFHVHTQRGTTAVGDVIPGDVSTPAARAARREALDVATGVRGTLIATLRRIIAAVGTRAAARTSPPAQTAPSGQAAPSGQRRP
jgi:hypothetical protein